jgi:hypothetical protein
MRHRNKWISVSGNARFPGLFSGIKFFAENHIYVPNVVSARIVLGVRELPQANGFAGSVVLLWRPGRGYTQTIELDGTHPNKIERLRLQVEYPTHWQLLRILQVFATTDHAAVAEVRGSRTAEPASDPHARDSPERLSPISEGSRETEDSALSAYRQDESSLVAMLTHDDPEMFAALAEVVGDWEPPAERPKLEDESSELFSRLPLSLININDDDVVFWHTTVDSDEINSTYCVFAVYPPMTVAISDVPRNPTCGEIVIFKVSADSVRREVVRRDDGILTGQQFEERWPEVQESMPEELLTWAKSKCFSRRAHSFQEYHRNQDLSMRHVHSLRS